jgi:integrase
MTTRPLEHRQLFRLVRNITFPTHATRLLSSNDWLAKKRSNQLRFAFYWPSGEPCIPVEMYLDDRAAKLRSDADRGGSLRAEASAITHLVRFCAREKVRFQDINADDFSAFTDDLVTEMSRRRFGWSARGANSVNTIISVSIRFLFWFQERFALSQPLVGIVDEKARIVLMRQKVRHFTGRMTEALSYPDRPQSDPTVPKSPMPDKHIRRLWDAACKAQVPLKISAQSGSSSAPPDCDLKEQYLFQRRLVTLMTMEETGLRPGEFCLMKTNTHANILSSRQLLIPTLKRREAVPFVRTLPCTLELASAIKLFLTLREDLVKSLPIRQQATVEKDQILFLNVHGDPLKASSLEREFSRLRVRADISDPERACLSMYRHRFLSRRAAFYIKAFRLQNSDPNVTGLPFTDDTVILGRLVELTGRKTMTSLRPYLREGWKELDVFSSIETAVASDDSIRSVLRRFDQIAIEISNTESVREAHRLLLELDAITKRLIELKNAFQSSANSPPEPRPWV